MKQRILIYRAVVFILAVVSAALALDCHITNAIATFYFPGKPMPNSALFIASLAVLAAVLLIEVIAVLIPKVLDWKASDAQSSI
jgi:hypothetical protein